MVTNKHCKGRLNGEDEACLKVGNGKRMNLGKRLQFAGDIQECVLLLAKSWYRDKRVLHFARGPAGKGA